MIKLDDSRRLHSDSGPALLWRDGFSVHVWHGLVLSDDNAWIIAQPERINKASILAETNTEIRRVMCEVIGWDRALEMLDGTCVSTDIIHGQARELIDIVVGDERMRVIRLRNGTLEPDGSRREFIEGVPLEVRSPHEAEAWQYGISQTWYSERIRT
jgi:hypothetical protein